MTKAEKQRIEKMLLLGCVVCAEDGFWVVPECHHILRGNKRLGHLYTIPLCAGHHRGAWPRGPGAIPPSIAGGRKLFNKVYGSELRLWQRIQRALGMDSSLPASKQRQRAA